MKRNKQAWTMVSLAGVALTTVGCFGGDETTTEPGVECSGVWADPNRCEADGSCADPAQTSSAIQEIVSYPTGDGDNTEIVRMIPGVDQAVFVASAARKVGFISYDPEGFEIVDSVVVAGATATSELPAIAVHPSGQWAAVNRLELDCELGYVMFIDLVDDPGAVLGEVQVGYNPDSLDISADGDWLVTADEDDREDRPCKPVDRHGGTVTIVDVSGGPQTASVVQTIAVDHDVDSEPEGVKISPDNDTVVVAIQETSEAGVFSLSDVPNASLSLVALEAESEPDGIAISDDGAFAVIGLERADAFAVLELPGGDVMTTYSIRNSGDVPSSYNRDEGGSTKWHEPEEVVLMRQGGALFAYLALQESHAVIAYNMTQPAAPVFDSIAHAGLLWEDEVGGTDKSVVGSEGLAGSEGTGILFSANERESSLTMYKTAFSAGCAAP